MLTPLFILECEIVTSWVLSCVPLVPTRARGWYVIISATQGTSRLRAKDLLFINGPQLAIKVVDLWTRSLRGSLENPWEERDLCVWCAQWYILSVSIHMLEELLGSRMLSVLYLRTQGKIAFPAS